jgi:PAS domain S-box-containing protein
MKNETTLTKESSDAQASIAQSPLLMESAQPPTAADSSGVWRGLGLACLLLAALTILKFAWAAQFGGAPSYLLYFSVILVGAWYGGLGVGLVMTVVSGLLGAYLFVPPGRAERFGLLADYLRFASFMIEGGVLSFLASRLKLGRARAAEAQQRAELSLAKLRGVLAAVDDGITVQDAHGRLVFANGPAARIVGYPSAEALISAKPDEIVQRFEIFAPDGTPFPASDLPGRRVLAGLAAPEQLLRFRVKEGGAERWALVVAKPVQLEGTAVPFAVNAFRDVTALRQQQEDLRLGREWFATALRSIGDAVIATDAAGRVTFMNPQAEYLTGWTNAEADRKPLQTVFRILREQTRETVESPVDRVLREGRVVGLANYTVLVSKSGVEFAIDDTAAPIRSESGELVGAVLVFRDVTRKREEERESVRLFAQIEAARKDAVQANRAKDEFLAMLGHELRNPLAPIVTALQLMKMKGADVFEKERTIVERQVRHVVTLVDDLLDVSRITRGKVDLQQDPVEVRAVIDRSLELAGPLIEERQHDVSVDVSSDLRVTGDAMRLSQVFSNLLTNAAKYTPPRGHIAIAAQQTGNEVTISVKDDGAGIDPELLPRIFELFVQDGQSLDRSQGGLGLGLAIVRSVVELHGGRVSAKSDGRGKGSEFSVVLPLLPPVRAKSGLQLGAAAPASSSALAQGARVLVVDDNQDALQLLAEALQLKGYQPLAAEDAASAIAVAQKHKPAVALLDIGLPVMNGYELARRLKAMPGLEAIKLAALTGYGQPSDKLQAIEAGFDEHLVKPISIEAVQAVVSRLLESAQVH